MIDEKQERASRVPRKFTDACLKRGDHALFVIRIESCLRQRQASLDFLAMMAYYYDCVFDGCPGDRVQDVFQKRAPLKGQKGLRPAHPFGFTRGEDNCRYQCRSPDLLRFHGWTKI